MIVCWQTKYDMLRFESSPRVSYSMLAPTVPPSLIVFTIYKKIVTSRNRACKTDIIFSLGCPFKRRLYYLPRCDCPGWRTAAGGRSSSPTPPPTSWPPAWPHALFYPSFAPVKKVFMLVRNSVNPDPHLFGCPGSGSVLGMRIRIQEHGKRPKFINKPGFLPFKRLLHLRRYVFDPYHKL